MDRRSNFGKFILLWAGELISSIGGGLTSFGLGVYIFNQTQSATGMALVTLLGFLPTLLFSVPAGLFMIGFGLFENVIPICVFGFGFFATLPFANNCLDYLARTNIADEVQGRAWGMIGFLSRIGYVIAYAISGIAADKLGKFTGLGVGRGAAAGVRIAGICMVLVAVICSLSASLRRLERAEGEC